MTNWLAFYFFIRSNSWQVVFTEYGAMILFIFENTHVQILIQSECAKRQKRTHMHKGKTKFDKNKQLPFVCFKEHHLKV